MRALATFLVFFLSACAPFVDPVRVDSLAPGSPGTFTYSVKTNTVMTENDDGEAEEIRQSWLAESLSASHSCPRGHAVDDREFVQPGAGIFANGGDIVYRGHCL
jgi:hypothetical protein